MSALWSENQEALAQNQFRWARLSIIGHSSDVNNVGVDRWEEKHFLSLLCHDLSFLAVWERGPWDSWHVSELVYVAPQGEQERDVHGIPSPRTEVKQLNDTSESCRAARLKREFPDSPFREAFAWNQMALKSPHLWNHARRADPNMQITPPQGNCFLAPDQVNAPYYFLVKCRWQNPSNQSLYQTKVT